MQQGCACIFFLCRCDCCANDEPVLLRRVPITRGSGMTLLQLLLHNLHVHPSCFTHRARRWQVRRGTSCIAAAIAAVIPGHHHHRPRHDPLADAAPSTATSGESALPSQPLHTLRTAAVTRSQVHDYGALQAHPGDLLRTGCNSGSLDPHIDPPPPCAPSHISHKPQQQIKVNR